MPDAVTAHLGPLPPPDAGDPDALLMRRCLGLALRGAGAVSPNPLVGAVVASADGRVLGEGFHARYGGPHAEPAAVADAEARHGADAARGAVLYVNLEPCAHHGKTPPCADLVVEKGFARVVIGMIDPFPEVAGRGAARMRAHGIDVRAGVDEAACRRLNAAFVHHVATGRPLVTLKIAQTLDGRIATPAGDSRWISGEASRRLVHRWRAALDAVLIGAGTARADDPALTVRHVSGRQPLRIVLDRAGALPPHLRLFTDEHADRSVAVHAPDVRPRYADALERRGGRLLATPVRDGHLDLAALLDALGRGDAGRPLQSLLVEAGPGLASALVAGGHMDRLALFVAPKLLGGGLAALDGIAPARMADARTFAHAVWETVGEDLLFRGERLKNGG